MIAFANSLDQAGIITRNVTDAAILMKVMCGYDPKDSTSVNLPVQRFENSIDGKIKGLKVGIPAEYDTEDLSDDIRQVWQKGREWLTSHGAEIVDVSLPRTSYAVPVYYIIAPAEASSNLACYDGIRYGARPEKLEVKDISEMYEKIRGENFGVEVKRRIMIGTHVLASGYHDQYYNKAQKVRKLIIQDFKNAFDKVDVLLTPTTLNSAYPIDTNLDPVTTYMNDIFTIPASLAGLPAISVPSGYTKDGLPLGLQLIGKKYDESNVFRFAGVLEKEAKFNLSTL